MPKIGFIGAGNMASAIISGMVKSGAYDVTDIYVYDIDGEKLEQLNQRLGITVCKDSVTLSQLADFILLSVKPHQISEVIKRIGMYLNHKCMVSIAAGITVGTLTSLVHSSVKVVRVMPNLALQAGEGMTTICSELAENDQALMQVKQIFDCAGKTMILPEEKMNAAMAIAGSSPAMVGIMIEAMADAGVLAGLTREQAYALAEHAVKGSAALLIEQGIHPAVLKDRVASPSGTTIEMIANLDKTAFRHSVSSSVTACIAKGSKLSLSSGKCNG